jgi:NADP-dependent 3-hydroxy acid dehydrogenase YdfG
MHILITGAANGIGKALTQVFIENLKSENVRLTLVDIDEDQLSTWETASVSVQYLGQSGGVFWLP